MSDKRSYPEEKIGEDVFFDWFGSPKTPQPYIAHRTNDGSTQLRCFICDGRGRRYIGERDPIEGSKMQASEICPFCHGNKYLMLRSPLGQACYAYYLAMDKVAEIRREEIIAKEAKRKTALAKLTDEELDLLGLNRE